MATERHCLAAVEYTNEVAEAALFYLSSRFCQKAPMLVLLGRVIKLISASVQPYHHVPDLIVVEVKLSRRNPLLKNLAMHLILLHRLNSLPPLNCANLALLLN